MSSKIAYFLLHVDYFGIGATTYTGALGLTYNFFYSEEVLRDNIISAMLILFFCNGMI